MVRIEWFVVRRLWATWVSRTLAQASALVSDTRLSYGTVLRVEQVSDTSLGLRCAAGLKGDEVSDTVSGEFPFAVVQIHSPTEEASPHATAQFAYLAKAADTLYFDLVGCARAARNDIYAVTVHHLR
jgi:hypothetical protein